MKFVIVAVTVLLAIGSSQANYPAKGHGGHVPCGANLLFSCHPNVAHVPCVPAHGHGHGGGYHHAAPAPHHPAPATYHHAPAHHAAPSYHQAPAHHAAPAYHAPVHHAPAPAKY